MLASGTSDVQRVFLLVVNEDEGRKIGVKIWTVRRIALKIRCDIAMMLSCEV